MDKTTTQITMLGTGNATVSQIYNTSNFRNTII